MLNLGLLSRVIEIRRVGIILKGNENPVIYFRDSMCSVVYGLAMCNTFPGEYNPKCLSILIGNQPKL